MERMARRAASYLGLVRREGEPDPVVTRREQGLMARVFIPGFVLLVLGLVLRIAGRGGLGLVATFLGLALIIGVYVAARRVRRARAKS